MSGVFAAREVYWSGLSARRTRALEAAYGWQMKRDGKYLRRGWRLRNRVKFSTAKPSSCCSRGACGDLQWRRRCACDGRRGGSEAVIDKDLAAALLAEQIMPMDW